jgi:hypothetical protein
MAQVFWHEERVRIADRTWLLMALIGVALSDHPEIKGKREFRQLADRARTALFELYWLLEPHQAQYDEGAKEGTKRTKVTRRAHTRRHPQVSKAK